MSKGVKNDGKVAFKQSFRTNNKLAENQNKKDFQEYIKKSQNKYVVAFSESVKRYYVNNSYACSWKKLCYIKRFY